MAIMYSLQLVRLREVPCAGQLPPVASMLRLHQPCYASLASASSLLAGKKFVQNLWCLPLLDQCQSSTQVAPKVSCAISSHSVTSLNQSKEMTVVLMKVSSALCTRVFKAMQESGLFVQCAPAVGLMAFAMWGLGPVLRIIRRVVLQKEDRHWKESQTLFILNSYLRPLILWIGVITICRAFDPIMLSTEASQAIKQRVLNFVRSLSTVLAFAYCTASLTQQLQKLMVDRQDSHDSRSVGVQFIGNTVYTAVWVAAVCLFMELLGFSTQRWLTAGGLGTVLLTLAGREIFTNFLSSIMIHATRPFVENEWIQTKIEGYEVSGTVEHVGWWSPTIVRGDDREAVHIPNHKFTVSVVRNLSQKTHWRIKTHFGISHLDVSKITNIVADMRKVLAKHPQVEQRRLHRRVFFDNIDPENQALLILVSCFVKTPHFEEYQRVKEIILLDLLKVISHHHARLATPIRSVQRIFDDTESRNAPFRDMASRSTDTHGRPFLLIEASSIANQQHEVEQSAKDVNGTSHRKEDTAKGIDTFETGTAKPGTGSSSAVNGKSDLKDSSTIESKSDFKSPVKQKENIAGEVSLKMGGLSVEAAAVSSTTKPQLEGLDSMGLNSKDITLLGAAFEKPPAKILDGLMESGLPKDVPQGEKVGARSTTDHQYQGIGSKDEQLPPKVGEKDATFPGPDKVAQEDFSGAELAVPGPIEVDSRIDTRRPQALGTATSSCPSPSKQECDRSSPGMSAAPRPQLEENLVLGVALDGPKRTLPLDEDISSPNDQKELVTSRNGNTNTAFKDRRESSQATSSSGPTDVRDRER